jgi:hypothetical protein
MANAATATTPGILARVSSYVEWGPISAGAVSAAAISFVLLAFGSAIGLTAVSPWSSSGLPVWLIAIIAALWLVLTQAGSYALGGYLAGRLRAPIGDSLPAERDFRDGAHGFFVWALGVVITAVVVGWTAGGVLKSGVDAVATVASGAAQGTATTASVLSPPDPLNYSIDRLMRSANAAPAAAQPAGAPQAAGATPNPSSPANPAVSDADRDQARRIFISALSTATLPPDDRAYLASRLSAVTGVPSADAEKRVDEAFAALQQAKMQAKEAADKARRAGAIAGFLAAAAALIAAAAAAAGAGLGGKHRDENGTLRMFGRERFW